MSVFTKLFHVSLFCNDIEKSLAFYKGMGCVEAFGIRTDPSAEPWDYYLKLCEGQYIELQPCKSNNPHPHPEKTEYYDNQTVWHLSFETDDMVEMIRVLRENGITIYQFPDPGAKEVKTIEDAIISPDGCFVCWVRDPDGTPIELMEQSGHSMQRRANKQLEAGEEHGRGI